MKRHFKAVLINWREHLKEEMQKTFDHLKTKGETFADPVDETIKRKKFAFELRTRDEKLINKIASSLEQIEQDDYGYCYSCGIEIGLKRLEARPTATHCIDCKTLDEIKEKNNLVGNSLMKLALKQVRSFPEKTSQITPSTKEYDEFALSIIKKLNDANFIAYLVGGCIRDNIVGIAVKDFDIATDATPEQIRKLFKASRIIGKRFKLVHVYKKNKVIEVSTFRSERTKHRK